MISLKIKNQHLLNYNQQRNVLALDPVPLTLNTRTPLAEIRGNLAGFFLDAILLNVRKELF